MQQYDEDTISLVDLIAVVVRHRRLIIIGTFLAGLLSVAALYLGPAVGLEVGPETVYTAERKILVGKVPTDLEQYLSLDPAPRLQSILGDPDFIGEVYAPFEKDPPEDRSRERYLSMIRREVIGETYTVAWDGSTRIITLSFTNSTPEDAGAFLSALTAAASAEFTSQVGPQVTEAIEVVEATLSDTQRAVARLTEMAVQRVGSSAVSGITAQEVLASLELSGGTTLGALADLTYARERLLIFAGSSRALLTVVDGTTIFEELSGTGRSTIVVITTITVFFMTVFLAFVLEYIRRVRQDREEMAKLEAAWRRE